MNIDFNIYTDKILNVVNEWEQKLLSLPEDVITERRNHQNRTIKQLLGHLVDSASNNHQRMVRLQYDDNLIFPDYTQDNDRWIAIQDYQHADWKNLVQLWKTFNLHIVHLIKSIDQSKLNNFWTDFEGNKVTLEDMIKGYPSHLNLHINDIKELITEKADKPTAIRNYDNFLLPADDYQKSVQFYSEVLGMEKKFEFAEQGMVAFKVGNEEPAIILKDTTKMPNTKPTIWIEVDDAKAVYERVKAKGVVFLSEPFKIRTGWAVEFNDPSGNRLGFTDYKND